MQADTVVNVTPKPNKYEHVIKLSENIKAFGRPNRDICLVTERLARELFNSGKAMEMNTTKTFFDI